MDSFKQLSNLINDFAKQHGLEEKLLEERIAKLWVETVGGIIAKYTKVIKFENGILYLNTESSTWRTEIRLRSKELCNKINTKLGTNSVKEIKIK